MFGKICVCLCLSAFVAHADQYLCNATQRDSREVYLNFEDNNFSDSWGYRGAYPADYGDSGKIDNIIRSQEKITFTLKGMKKGTLDLEKLRLELEGGGPQTLNCQIYVRQT
ncbi:MAG: hypothetical protein WCK49_05375 [Myxococcaceae bacterium]